MIKKNRIIYRIRPELDQIFADYARAAGKKRTDVIIHIIENYLSSQEITNKLKNIHLGKITVKRKDWINWKPRGDYILPSHFAKIKLMATASKISISEVMDDILDSYLSKVATPETIEQSLDKAFSQTSI